jgi:hypothetical protein
MKEKYAYNACAYPDYTIPLESAAQFPTIYMSGFSQNIRHIAHREY